MTREKFYLLRVDCIAARSVGRLSLHPPTKGVYVDVSFIAFLSAVCVGRRALVADVERIDLQVGRLKFSLPTANKTKQTVGQKRCRHSAHNIRSDELQYELGRKQLHRTTKQSLHTHADDDGPRICVQRPPSTARSRFSNPLLLA